MDRSSPGSFSTRLSLLDCPWTPPRPSSTPRTAATSSPVDLLPDESETPGTDLTAADRNWHLFAGTVAAIEASVPSSARRAYAGDRHAFAAWCVQEDQGRNALPAAAETVAEYVRQLTVVPQPRTGRLSSPSIERACPPSPPGTARSASRAPRRTAPAPPRPWPRPSSWNPPSTPCAHWPGRHARPATAPPVLARIIDGDVPLATAFISGDPWGAAALQTDREDHGGPAVIPTQWQLLRLAEDAQHAKETTTWPKGMAGVPRSVLLSWEPQAAAPRAERRRGEGSPPDRLRTVPGGRRRAVPHGDGSRPSGPTHAPTGSRNPR